MIKNLLLVHFFLDVSKAFDSLNHKILLPKLELRDIALNWFKSYFLNRFQFTNISHSRTLFRLINSGISHGSIMGPYSYFIHVNDLFHVSCDVKCLLYADDKTLLVVGDNIKTLLTNACTYFTLFSIWFRDNLLIFNAKKSSFVIFHAPHKPKTDSVNVPDVLHFDLHITLVVSIL